MTREPSQGGSDVIVTDDVSQPAIQEQPERYEPDPEPEQLQQQPGAEQQSKAASEADSDDFRLR
eukprot:3845014-Rhodomonas_salina.1